LKNKIEYYVMHGFNDSFCCGRGLCEYLKSRIRQYPGEVLTQQGITLYHRYFVRPTLHSIALFSAPAVLDRKQRFGNYFARVIRAQSTLGLETPFALTSDSKTTGSTHITAPSGTAARGQNQRENTAAAPPRSILGSGLANQRSDTETSPQYLSLARGFQGVTVLGPRAGSIDHPFPAIYGHFPNASELLPPISKSDAFKKRRSRDASACL
jgi:hypothetical protein